MRALAESVRAAFRGPQSEHIPFLEELRTGAYSPVFADRTQRRYSGFYLGNWFFDVESETLWHMGGDARAGQPVWWAIDVRIRGDRVEVLAVRARFPK